MGCRWNHTGFQYSCFMFLVITLQSRSSLSLNSEGKTYQQPFLNLVFFGMFLIEMFLNVIGFLLLKFRERVDSDPHGTLANWNISDDHLCSWFGVTCVDNKIQML